MALLDVLSVKPVFDLSNEYDFQKPLELRNSSDNNLVAFRLTTNTPPGLFLGDPPKGIVERNTMVVSIIMDPNVPYAPWEHYKLCIKALDVACSPIDLERFWTNMYTDDPWENEKELVVLDPDPLQGGADTFENSGSYGFNSAVFDTPMEGRKCAHIGERQKLNPTVVLPLIIVILGIWFLW